MPDIEQSAARAIAAWVRAEAENKDYAAMCEWRNVADAIEREADDDHLWLCGDCKALNGDHEAFCFRCGAGQPEDDNALITGQMTTQNEDTMPVIEPGHKPSDPVNPYIDSYAWDPAGCEMAAEGTIREVQHATRGQAVAWFARELGEDITAVRVWKRYVRPLTRGEVWDDYGREAWEQRRDLDADEGPDEPPSEWEPDEYDPVWQFIHRSHPDAIAVWVCGVKGNEPPPNPRKP